MITMKLPGLNVALVIKDFDGLICGLTVLDSASQWEAYWAYGTTNDPIDFIASKSPTELAESLSAPIDICAAIVQHLKSLARDACPHVVPHGWACGMCGTTKPADQPKETPNG